MESGSPTKSMLFIFYSCRILLSIVVALVVLGTALDFWTGAPRNQFSKSNPKDNVRNGAFVRTMLCFSARANTRMLLEVRFFK